MMIPKFRAWDKEDEVMIDWFWLSSEGNLYETPVTVYDTPHLELERNDDLIAMQSTGLKDKNGVEIYEGDIITYECDEGYGLETVVTKVGKFPSFDIEVGYRDYDLTPIYFAIEEYWDFKVIGNIYENPELME